MEPKFRVLSRQTVPSSPSDSELDQALDQIKSSGCKVVFGVLDFTVTKRTAALAKQKSLFGFRSGYTWLLPEATYLSLSADSLGSQSRDFEGVFVTYPIDVDPTYPLFDQKVASPVPYARFLWDAVLSYAYAIRISLDGGLNPLDHEVILRSLKKVSFDGATGRVEFDSNLNRRYGEYGVFNYRNAEGKASLIAKLDGHRDLVLTNEANIVFSDGSSTIPDDLEISEINFSSGGAIAILFLNSWLLGWIAGATSIALLIEYLRGNRLIMRSSPLFLSLILFGLTLALVSVDFWFGKPTPLHCNLRVWLAFMGCGIAYSAILTKNYQLWHLFNEPSLRVTVISPQRLLSLMGLILAPLALVLLVWSSVAPFQVRKQENSAFSKRYWSCHSSQDYVMAPLTAAYMFFLFIVGGVLSLKTRTLPDTFRESYWVALCSYNLVFVSAVGMLVGYLLSFEPGFYPYIVTVCILFCALMTWALIFVPKFWLIWAHPDRIVNHLASLARRSSREQIENKSIRAGGSAAQLLAAMGAEALPTSSGPIASAFESEVRRTPET